MSGEGLRGTHSVATEETSDVDLVIGGTLQMVIAVAGHEVPLRAKVMVNARHAEVVVQRYGQIGAEIQGIHTVANTIAGEWTAASSRSRQRHMVLPHLLRIGIDPDASRIERIQIVGGGGVVGIVQDPVAHVLAGNQPVK